MKANIFAIGMKTTCFWKDIKASSYFHLNIKCIWYRGVVRSCVCKLIVLWNVLIAILFSWHAKCSPRVIRWAWECECPLKKGFRSVCTCSNRARLLQICVHHFMGFTFRTTPHSDGFVCTLDIMTWILADHNGYNVSDTYIHMIMCSQSVKCIFFNI